MQEKMEKQVIPIIYASDENFLKQTYVSMYSVLSNRKEEYEIKFYIVVPEVCIVQHYDEDWDFTDYSIEYRVVSDEYFKNVKMTLQNISKPTYYRLLIPVLFPEYEKCLYLDGDTICLNDIYELYEIELEDNFLLAGKGAVIQFDLEKYAKKINIPSGINYFNAGVLSMNLQLLRRERKTEEFLRYSERELPCQDQDVLNICCFNRIKIFPAKYNIYNTAYNTPLMLLLERYTLNDIEEALKNPVIIHYATEYSKPWNNSYAVKGEEWWEYAQKALPSEEHEKMKLNSCNRIKRYSYCAMYEKIRNSDEVIVFGFSEIGKGLCDEIDSKYPNKIVGFCDNDEKKRREKYKSYEVMDVQSMKELYPDAVIVITSQNFSDIIQKQLIEEGFELERLLIYRKKTLKYIYSFDKKYWNEVKKDISMNKLSSDECIKIGEFF